MTKQFNILRSSFTKGYCVHSNIFTRFFLSFLEHKIITVTIMTKTDDTLSIRSITKNIFNSCRFILQLFFFFKIFVLHTFLDKVTDTTDTESNEKLKTQMSERHFATVVSRNKGTSKLLTDLEK